MKELARFMFEVGMLKKMRRTGYPFLGSGGESVADHCFRAALLGYQLALSQDGLDAPKVALMLLHHDLAETRTGDLNYVHKRYSKADEDKALNHQARRLPQKVSERMLELTSEFNAKETPESLLAHDADQLDLLIELKEQMDLNNPYAAAWIHYALKRLETEPGKALAKEIMQTDWTDWWFEKRDDWWAPNNCKPPEYGQ